LRSFIAKPYELRVAETIFRRLLKKFDRRDQFRSEPATFIHVLGGQPFTPPPLASVRQIPEWALVGEHLGKEREKLEARRRTETASDSARVHQGAARVVPDEY
jgi:hypothetical protein